MVKGQFTTVKVSRVTASKYVLNRLIATVIIHVTMSLWSKAKWLPAHGNIVRPLKKDTIQLISHYKHSLVTCRQNIQSKIFILLPEKTVAWS